MPDSVVQQAKQMLAPDAVDRLVTFLKVRAVFGSSHSSCVRSSRNHSKDSEAVYQCVPLAVTIACATPDSDVRPTSCHGGQEPSTKLACKRLGIIPDSLKPRPLQSFREGPTDTPDAMEIKSVHCFFMTQ